MKFKVGDKVMLKAVPYANFIRNGAQIVYDTFKNKKLKVIEIISTNKVVLNNYYAFNTKYLKHTAKLKNTIKYTLDCSCLPDAYCNTCKNICGFIGTKSQVKARIKKYWKQPKIKAVK